MANLHLERGGTLLGILIGIVIGVLISFGVVWTMNKTPLPFRDKGVRTVAAGMATSRASSSTRSCPAARKRRRR